MDVQELIERVRNDPRVPKGQGASENDLAEAERQLGQFPPDYRAFLAAFGWVKLRTETLYGLGPSVPAGCNLVESTGFLRNYEEVEWPTHFARLADLGTGDAWILLLDPDEDGLTYVLFADVHLGELVYQADSFTDWLNAILDDPDLLVTSGKNGGSLQE